MANDLQKKRRPNFTQNELLTMVQAISEKRDIIFKDTIDLAIGRYKFMQLRQHAWRSITDAIVEANGFIRFPNEVKKKFKYFKSKVSIKRSKEKQAIKNGGHVSVSYNSAESALLELLSQNPKRLATYEAKISSLRNSKSGNGIYPPSFNNCDTSQVQTMVGNKSEVIGTQNCITSEVGHDVSVYQGILPSSPDANHQNFQNHSNIPSPSHNLGSDHLLIESKIETTEHDIEETESKTEMNGHVGDRISPKVEVIGEEKEIEPNMELNNQQLFLEPNFVNFSTPQLYKEPLTKPQSTPPFRVQGDSHLRSPPSPPLSTSHCYLEALESMLVVQRDMRDSFKTLISTVQTGFQDVAEAIKSLNRKPS